MTKQPENSGNELFDIISRNANPTADQFRELVIGMDNHRLLAKVFLLEGTPAAFASNPTKYVIFREQLADRFDVGSQDVCIVGSARLGFSPSPYSFGQPFSKTSDVDVVIISEQLFYDGSQKLFAYLKDLPPESGDIKRFLYKEGAVSTPKVDLWHWKDVKEGMRNFAFENLNPDLFPENHPWRNEIFDKIASSSGLFLALLPSVFVSKIRARIFKSWKAAEDYYSNSLREAKKFFEKTEAKNYKFNPPDREANIIAPLVAPATIKLSELTRKPVEFEKATATKLEFDSSNPTEHKGRLIITVSRPLPLITAWIYLNPSMVGDVKAEVKFDNGDSQNDLTIRTGYISKWKFSVHLRSPKNGIINSGTYVVNFFATSAPRTIMPSVVQTVNGNH